MDDTLSPPHYASFGRRALALVIDAFVVGIPASASHFILPFFGPIAISLLYSPVLEASPFRATLGKHLAGIQVVTLEGGTISLRTAYLRYFCKSFIDGIFFLGYFFALFTARRQTLHDLIVDTVVVYGRRDGSLWDAWLNGVKDLFGKLKSSANDASANTYDTSATRVPTMDSQTSLAQLEQLERLQKLRESGVLTEEEFLEQKRKILSRL